MNAAELNHMLSGEIKKLQGGRAKIANTKVIVQCASQIVASARLELAHARLVGSPGGIPFFGRKSIPAPRRGKKK